MRGPPSPRPPPRPLFSGSVSRVPQSVLTMAAACFVLPACPPPSGQHSPSGPLGLRGVFSARPAGQAPKATPLLGHHPALGRGLGPVCSLALATGR